MCGKDRRHLRLAVPASGRRESKERYVRAARIYGGRKRFLPTFVLGQIRRIWGTGGVSLESGMITRGKLWRSFGLHQLHHANWLVVSHDQGTTLLNRHSANLTNPAREQ